MSLTSKRYRLTPREKSVQHTVHCAFQESVKNGSGQTFGMFPIVIQSKYRIDEKRPMCPDGITEKKPWSECFVVYHIYC